MAGLQDREPIRVAFLRWRTAVRTCRHASLLGVKVVCPATRRKVASGETALRLISGSRVVMGQVWRNSVLLQDVRMGRDRGGIFGKSHFLSALQSCTGYI